MDKKKKNIIICSIIFAILLIAGIVYAIVGFSEENDGIFSAKKEEIQIQEPEYKTLEYETFSNADISMKIPKGWKVDYFSGSVSGIRAYNPDNEMYSIYYFFEIGCFNKTKESQQYYQKMSGVWKYGFEKFPVLNPATTENFYKIWTTTMSYIKQQYGEKNYPYFYNFKVIETSESNSLIKQSMGSAANESILRATFTDAMETKTGEGLFSACIVDAVPNQWYFPLTAYNVMGITAPEGEFINWETALTQCLSTIEYSESFVNAHIEQSNQLTKQTLQVNAEIQAAFDSYCDAWNTRQTSYDVSSQKYSDATLGYDRVYDKNTGEIYKAETGWYDSYNSNREDYKNTNLELVTDDSMYLQSVDGYITK